MPYVNAAKMLQLARTGHYAVGQFNINNLESIRTFIEAAEASCSPLILGVSGGIVKRLGGYRTIADTVKNLLDYLQISAPVCLHADHSTYDGAVAALENGFSSVMFDGSKLPFAENLEKTQALLEMCRAKGVSLEVEVGAVAGKEDGGYAPGEYANPVECGSLASLGVDMLAASIGNMHGQYPPDWQGLDFGLLEAVGSAVGAVPLVLHGGSGIPDEMIRQAIDCGICKINVNSECRAAFAEATRRFIMEDRDIEDTNNMQLITMQPGLAAMKRTCLEKMQLFGCIGKAGGDKR